MSARTSADELRRIVRSSFESGMNHDRQAAALDELVERASRSTPREPSPEAIEAAAKILYGIGNVRIGAEAALRAAYKVDAGASRPSASPDQVRAITLAIGDAEPESGLFDNVPSDMTWGELVRAVASRLTPRGETP